MYMQVDVVVAGVVYKSKPQSGGVDDQGRKILILYEVASEAFFLGKWTKYKRIPADGAAPEDSFDMNDSSLVKTIGDTQHITTSMLASENLQVCLAHSPLTHTVTSGWLTYYSYTQGIKTAAMLKKRAEEPPPAIKLHRSEEKKEHARTVKEDAKRQKKIDAAMAKQVEASRKKVQELLDKAAKAEAKAAEAEKSAQQAIAARHNLSCGVTQEREKAKSDLAAAKEILQQADELKKQATALSKAGMLPTPPLAQGQVQPTLAPTPLPPPPPPPPPLSGLPPNWEVATDAQGCPYYFNRVLNAVQYEKPPNPTQHVMYAGGQASAATPSDILPATNYLSVQRGRMIARFRAMLQHLDGTEKAKIAGDLAALEMEAYHE